MNQLAFTVLAYAVGLLALWGYAAGLWLEGHALDQRQRRPLTSGDQKNPMPGA